MDSTPVNANYSSSDGTSQYVGSDQGPQAAGSGGSATIVCDGEGGYRPELNGWAGQPCGISDCVTGHEESHAQDWASRYPDGCDGKPDGGNIPLGGAGYNDFLNNSECKAYTREADCERKLYENAGPECRDKVGKVLDDTIEQQKKYCGEEEDYC